MYLKYRLRSRKLLELVSEAFEFFDVLYTIKYVKNKTTLWLLVYHILGFKGFWNMVLNEKSLEEGL